MAVGAIGLVLGSIRFISSILPSQLSSVSIEAATATEGLLRASTVGANTITFSSLDPLIFSGLIGISSGVIIGATTGVISRRLSDEEDIIRAFGELYTKKIINDKLPKEYIRQILVRAGIIGPTAMTRSKFTKDMLIQKIHYVHLNNELKKATFHITKVYSWKTAMISLMNEATNNFFHFSPVLFSKNRIDNKCFSGFSIERFFEFLIIVQDNDLNNLKRKNLLHKLDVYAKKIGYVDYETALNKIDWLMFRSIQSAISKERGTFIGLSKIGMEIWSDGAIPFERFVSESPIYKTFLLKIASYCEDNIKDPSLIAYKDFFKIRKRAPMLVL